MGNHLISGFNVNSLNVSLIEMTSLDQHIMEIVIVANYRSDVWGHKRFRWTYGRRLVNMTHSSHKISTIFTPRELYIKYIFQL